MDKYAENVALLYLLKSKDISSLTLEQLYELYADTVKQATSAVLFFSISVMVIKITPFLAFSPVFCYNLSKFMQKTGEKMPKVYACLLGKWECLNDDPDCKFVDTDQSPSAW